jgi:hypothetical protein
LSEWSTLEIYWIDLTFRKSFFLTTKVPFRFCDPVDSSRGYPSRNQA